jgi:putative inorganic carbon (hco3(-)) transporter
LISINNHKKQNFLSKKMLLNRATYTLVAGVLVVVALVAGFMAATGKAYVTFGVGAVLIGILVVHACLFNPIKGIYLLMFIAFFTAFPGRLLDKQLPITTFVEVLVLFLFIGTYWSSKKDGNQKGNLAKYSVSIFLTISILYYIIELFNPNVDSIVGWLFNSKRFTAQILFFIIAYRLINTPERFKYFIKFWIVMSFVAALYGCYQQWFGMFQFEINSIDAHEWGLMFQGGVLRKFSFLEGVGTFGTLCGFMLVLTTILAINEKNKSKRYKLVFAAIILFLGTSYSGTRTTTIMLPMGIALYILMTLKSKATILTLSITILSLLFIIFAPIDNPTINRMRSTFDSKDESLNVRTMNRKSIQPYIYSHPIGGGVATSGLEGTRFNPGHRLAGFPPDSGFLQMALDMGWIGLIIMVSPFLMFLYQGIHYYFRIKNPQYKLYIVAITCSIFAIVITLYAQVPIGNMPSMFFIFAVLSLIKRLMEFDKTERGIDKEKAINFEMT